MKQTAVEWLFDNLNITGGSDDMKAFEQAKAMEKEQIIRAGADHCYPTEEIAIQYAEQYYNETFKSE